MMPQPHVHDSDFSADICPVCFPVPESKLGPRWMGGRQTEERPPPDVVSLPVGREELDELLDIASAALIERGLPADNVPAPRWFAACVLGAVLPCVIPDSAL